MDNFEKQFNEIIIEVYHNILLMEETKRKYSKASFSFRDRNAVTYLSRFEDGKTISEVANYLRISRPSATVLIKKLDKYGLVEKHTEPGNERNTIVMLTKKGKMFAAFQHRYRKRLTEAVCEGLDADEQDALYKGLDMLNDFFNSTIDEMEVLHSKKKK